MNSRAQELILLRKQKWNEKKELEYDRRFCSAIAYELYINKKLKDEVKEHPEYLIELTFVIVDKNQKLQPFFLNDVQKEFLIILNKAIDDFENGLITDLSFLILKGRQQGFTSFVTAYQLSCSILHDNFQGFTLADKADNAESIFQNKAKFAYNQLSEIIKPTEKFNNKRQFVFEKINSSWSIDTATKDVGRSRTINFFHGSECAFWKDGLKPIQAALGEAFTKNCIKIYESTANGYNDYQELWDSHTCINCFFEWWKTKEYRLHIPSELIKNEFVNNINTKDNWIFKRLRWLRDDKNLDIEQLYWYFKKYEGYLDKKLIKQEYPCTPEEAFLMSGETVFDTEALLSRLSNIPKPLKIGYFIYDYNGLKISNIRWVNDSRNGYIRIYELPNTPIITKYAIGGDTAGDGSDFFTGHVVNGKTGKQCAVLKKEFDPVEYVRQMYCLGVYYKYALIAIETNFNTYPVIELQRLNYPNQYVREKIDEYTHKKEKKFGFNTNTSTRPMIVSNLLAIVKDDVEVLNDEDTIRELMSITKNEKGKIEAPQGKHDDQMMGIAIAHQARTQLNFSTEPIIQPVYKDFNILKNKESYRDYGEKQEVI